MFFLSLCRERECSFSSDVCVCSGDGCADAASGAEERRLSCLLAFALRHAALVSPELRTVVAIGKT